MAPPRSGIVVASAAVVLLDIHYKCIIVIVITTISCISITCIVVIFIIIVAAVFTMSWVLFNVSDCATSSLSLVCMWLCVACLFRHHSHAVITLSQGALEGTQTETLLKECCHLLMLDGNFCNFINKCNVPLRSTDLNNLLSEYSVVLECYCCGFLRINMHVHRRK